MPEPVTFPISKRLLLISPLPPFPLSLGSSSVFGSLTGRLGNGKKAKRQPSSSASSASSTTFAKAAAAAAATKKAPTQTFLDFGQKSLGKRTLCGVCGLLYVNGEAEDEKDHAIFCRSVSAGLAFQGWKDQRLVWGAEGKDRVIEVRPADGGPQLLKMGEVKRIMDQEMGFVPLAEGESVLRPTEKAFLYVHDKRVVGCLVAEKIAAAHPVLEAMPSEEEEEEGAEGIVAAATDSKKNGGGGKKACHDRAEGEKEEQEEEEQEPPSAKMQRVDDKDTSSSSTTTTTSSATTKPKALAPPRLLLRKGGKDKEEEAPTSLLPKGVAYSLHDKAEATLGVKQIWVSKNSRRKGIARRMVEVARGRFYYGFVVPRDKVAFSQLSNAGYSFARSYTEGGGATLLVY